MGMALGLALTPRFFLIFNFLSFLLFLNFVAFKFGHVDIPPWIEMLLCCAAQHELQKDRHVTSAEAMTHDPPAHSKSGGRSALGEK